MDVIHTTGLYKYFGDTPAANDISISVRQGEIYGFLGLNGAGKTTLIRMLLGMIQPDKGNIQLLGKELNRSFKNWNDVGYLVETPYSYPELTVAENLQVYYQYRILKEPGLIDEVICKLKLTQYRDKKAKVLSLGNQQRLGLAKALMHNPRLLILDEPVNGLDPEGIVEVRELLKELAQGGTTIFLSSHILGEIARLADRIGIIHKGSMVKELTCEELSQQVQRKLLINTTDNIKAVELLKRSGFEPHMNTEGDVELTDKRSLSTPESITAMLSDSALPPRKVFEHTEDLEMFFLRTIRS
ncbi:MAG: ABC transporter ATP-binding protein [Chitinophagales bacterium]|nr:ABC transporter ATP-binding protein [Chitinophagales bacterium]